MTMASVATKRRNESDNDKRVTFIRSDRLFTQNGYWYFKTRERIDIGPFDNAEMAEEGIKNFIDFLCNAEPTLVKRVTDYVTDAA